MADIVRFPDSPFVLHQPFPPAGDQPKAIEALVDGLSSGLLYQTLLGVTGSGKTYTMANVIARLGVPAIIMAPNKTLAAQTYAEMRDFFPENAVEYFVSYYDFYQPEAYVPARDLFIEKDAAVNEHIEQMRLAATKSILERRDTIIVATVSAIYGIGKPESYTEMRMILREGDRKDQRKLITQLVKMQYRRTDTDFVRGTFRVRGDTIDVFPAEHAESAVRIELFDDEVESVLLFDPLTGRVQQRVPRFVVYPASHYVTPREEVMRAMVSIKEELKLRTAELYDEGRIAEAQRLQQRTLFDLEMLDQVGFCKGIENYSRHLTGLAPGEAPPCLIDYLPTDSIMFFDESHVMMGQLGGMYRGDRARKETLVNYGFRLPSALDNRPLRFDEFERKMRRSVFVSATPADYELEKSGGEVVEQVVRPTGLVDPQVEVRPATTQVDDLLSEITITVAKGERVLVTTLTKRMAEDLTDFLSEHGVRVRYLHSDIDTVERVEIIRDLRARVLVTTLTKRMAEDLTDFLSEHGVRVRYLHSDIDTVERVEIIRDLRAGHFDVLVGINLLREGLDIPEVSLVAILDADKEGFLRSERSLIQTIGRAARNLNGRAILYADRMTDSMKRALTETERRREKQLAYNKEHGITPRGVKKEIRDIIDGVYRGPDVSTPATPDTSTDYQAMDEKAVSEKLRELEARMMEFARNLDFEKAAKVREQIHQLRREVFGASVD